MRRATFLGPCDTKHFDALGLRQPQEQREGFGAAPGIASDPLEKPEVALVCKLNVRALLEKNARGLETQAS